MNVLAGRRLVTCVPSLQSSATMATMTSVDPKGKSFQQTMLRVKDPKASVDFYRDIMGFRFIDEIKCEEKGFTQYYMATLPESVTLPTPGTPEAHKALFSLDVTTLNLTHIHGSESDGTTYDSGNNEPQRGFGHIAVTCPDVYAACEELEKKGVSFKKKPDEGRMKGLAFAYDPDGYWIEIIRRPADMSDRSGFWLNQTMLRVKDPSKSIAFYSGVLGMSVICERHFPDAKFSLYFLATLPAGQDLPDPSTPEAMEYTKTIRSAVIELTHNHGTEAASGRTYHDGNTDPKGFGHVSFIVPDVEAAKSELEEASVLAVTTSHEATLDGAVTVQDPDGYHVQLLPCGWDAGVPAGK